MHTQGVRLRAPADAALGQRIGVNADKEVRLGLVGNIGPFGEFHEHIGLAGVHDLHVRTVLLHQPAQFQGYGQVDVLLLALPSQSSSVTSAMTGIYHHNEILALHRHDATQ